MEVFILFSKRKEAISYAENNPNIVVRWDAGDNWIGEGYYKNGNFYSWLINPEGTLIM